MIKELYIKDIEFFSEIEDKFPNVYNNGSIISEYNNNPFMKIIVYLIEDKVVGFIDLGDSGIGDPWRDYAWSIWSLEYNLKTNKYTNLLLEKLNIKFDKEKFDRYINE